MGQLKFNIDHVSDDQYFAVTEAIALAGAAFEEKGPETLLIISLGAEGSNDAILAGSLGEGRLEKLEEMLQQLKERAQEEEPDDALVLHLEEQP
ncbi:hypothetical protein CO724_17335 [Ectopseudomonas mendocina]|nr:hypothetical protein CO724_17335 [Pseudomonas mendocina]